MNWKFVGAVGIMVVIGMPLGMLVHGALLSDEYAKLPYAARPPAEAQARIGWMIAAYICIATAFTWIYLKGKDETPWFLQGLRYGTAIAFLTAIPTYLIYHVIAFFPLDLAIKALALDFVVVVFMAVVLAWIYR